MQSRESGYVKSPWETSSWEAWWCVLVIPALQKPRQENMSSWRKMSSELAWAVDCETITTTKILKIPLTP